MKKYLALGVLLLIGIIIFGSGCGKPELDPKKAMMGIFNRDGVTLNVTQYNESSFKDNVDFQFDYYKPGVSSGTLFGQAELEGGNLFKYEYESLGVIHKADLNFVDGKWEVKYSAEDPKNKEHFDYTGTYIKKD